MNCKLQKNIEKSAIKVSVIIPVYNVENYLRKTIDSCLKQSLFEIEIIIVNDGSQDNSRKIIEAYVSQDDKITAIYKENEGVTIARNTGLKIAKGEYIFFLDGDDYIGHNTLEKMYIAAKEKDADFVVGDFVLEYPNGEKMNKKFYDFGELDNIGLLKYCFLRGDFYFTGRLIKRNLIQSASIEIPKEITFGEDNIAVVQLAFNLKKAIKINETVLCYVQRNASVTNKLANKDLKYRADACAFVLEYVKMNKIESKIQFEMEVFVLNEIYSSIVRGYVDTRLLNYLKLPFMKQPYRSFFSYKKRLMLFLASINYKQTIYLFQQLKNLKQLIVGI